MPNLINAKTSLAENIPQNKVGEAFLSGTHNFHANDKVPLLNPDGQLVTVDAREVYPSVTEGQYRFPTDSDLHEADLDAQYGDGIGNSAKALAAGAARAATFGASDEALTASGLASPETLRELNQRHPYATFGGETAGIVGSLLAPEIGGGLKALNAVKGVSRVGQLVEHAIAPAAEGVAGKVLARVGAKAAGSAVEGAAYGLGQSVTEHALGDPELNSEKVLSNVGYGALFGGGIGGVLGIPSTLLAKEGQAAGKFISELDQAKVDAGDFGATINAAPGFTDAEKKSVIEGLTAKKANAADIQAAADTFGVPVIPGQLADSQAVQKAAGLLANEPATAPALRYQNLIRDSVDKVNQGVQDVLGGGEPLTKAQAGDLLKQSLTEKFEAEKAPIEKLYNAIKTDYQTIPLADKVKEKLASDLMQIDGISLSPSSPQYQLAKSVAEEIPNLKTVDDLKQYQTILRQRTAGQPGLRFVTGQIAEKLGALEENSIVGFAKHMAVPTPEAQDAVLQLLRDRELANSQYKALREKMQTFGKVLGKSKVYGPQDFLDFLEQATPEKLADRLFTKKNSQFLQFLDESFPEEMGTLRRYQKGRLLGEATKTGDFRPQVIFRELDKLEPEVRKAVFTPEELDKLQKAKLYLKELPANPNPSGTSHASAARAFFASPTGAAMANIRDFAIDKFIKHATIDDTSHMARVATLSRIERAAQKTSQAVASGAKRALLTTSKSAGGLGALIPKPDRSPAEREEDKEQRIKRFEKTQDQLHELAGLPEVTLDKLSDSTRFLSQHAPNITAALQQKGAVALSFLNSKLPQPPNQKALSAKWTPSHADISKFERYQSIVEDPTRAFKQIQDGTMTPETVETLQTVYPKLYQEMKSSLMDELTNLKDRPGYQRRLMLSLFLGSDVDDSLEPAAVAANQQTLAGIAVQNAQTQGAAGGVPPSQKGLSSLTASAQALTPMQKTAQRT